MVQIAGYANSFAAGELAEDAWERSDLQQHQSGCAEALNLIGLTTGPVVSRGGMMRRGEPAYDDMFRRLFAWSRSDGEGLVLEFGHLYARVWTARGAQIMDGDEPYEFEHAYSEADLPGLRLAQVGDVAFITSRDGLLNLSLKRLADDDWEIGTYELRDGPFLAENTDQDLTLTFTSLGFGLFTMAASAPLFEDGHLGAIFRVRPPGGAPGLPTWSPDTVWDPGEQAISGGRIYETLFGGTTGNTAPSHDRDTVSDGLVDWTFVHDGAATVAITAVIDDQTVTVQPQSELPLDDATPTSNWSEGAFNGVRGFPTSLSAIREERLCQAGTPYQPDVIQMTRTAGFTPTFADFKPGLGTGLVVDDDAVRVRLGEKRARIVWMVDAMNFLVGTTDAEYVVSGGTLDDPITPASVKPRRISSYGSADVTPVVLQGPPLLLLHVARGQRTLRELQLGAGAIDVAGRDLSILSQHVFGLGVTDMAWSRQDSNLWLLLADGSLACFTYHVEHQVMGVRRQPMPGGWLAEAIATAPDPDGRDRLHVAAVRTKDGDPQRAHFVLSERPLAGQLGVFMDCAEQYAGAPVTTIGGLDHLEGETVAVVADGAQQTDKVVEDGEITLDEAASAVTVGLKMLRRFKSLPLDPDRQGALLSKLSRITHAYVVLGCVTAEVGAEPQDAPPDEVIYDQVDTRRPGDAVPVVRRLREKVKIGSVADRDNRLVAQTDAPFDFAVYALRPVLEVPSS